MRRHGGRNRLQESLEIAQRRGNDGGRRHGNRLGRRGAALGLGGGGGGGRGLARRHIAVSSPEMLGAVVLVGPTTRFSGVVEPILAATKLQTRSQHGHEEEDKRPLIWFFPFVQNPKTGSTGSEIGRKKVKSASFERRIRIGEIRVGNRNVGLNRWRK